MMMSTAALRRKYIERQVSFLASESLIHGLSISRIALAMFFLHEKPGRDGSGHQQQFCFFCVEQILVVSVFSLKAEGSSNAV